MRSKPLGPEVPEERHETIRRRILGLLRNGPLSARELSAEVGIGEKAVYEHLVHIGKTAGVTFRVRPASCKKCGFVFKKREKLKKPGRCPVCKNESIAEPLFWVEKV
jgi:transcriptional regulator